MVAMPPLSMYQSVRLASTLNLPLLGSKRMTLRTGGLEARPTPKPTNCVVELVKLISENRGQGAVSTFRYPTALILPPCRTLLPWLSKLSVAMKLKLFSGICKIHEKDRFDWRLVRKREAALQFLTCLVRLPVTASKAKKSKEMAPELLTPYCSHTSLVLGAKA